MSGLPSLTQGSTNPGHATLVKRRAASHAAAFRPAQVGCLSERRHGVAYDADHLSRLVRSWGLSGQKPATRPIERDEAAVRRWLKCDWPRVKKKPRG